MPAARVIYINEKEKKLVISILSLLVIILHCNLHKFLNWRDPWQMIALIISDVIFSWLNKFGSVEIEIEELFSKMR